MAEQAKVPAIRFAGLLTLGNSVRPVRCSKSLMTEDIRHCLFCQRRRIKA